MREARHERERLRAPRSLWTAGTGTGTEAGNNGGQEGGRDRETTDPEGGHQKATGIEGQT